MNVGSNRDSIIIDSRREWYATTLHEANGRIMLARLSILLFAMISVLCSCAGVSSVPRQQVPTVSEGRPVVAGIDDQIVVRAMSVRLPLGEGWRKREIPIPDEGVLFEFERDLSDGIRVQIHIADYFGPTRLLPMELVMSGLSDKGRLGFFLGMVMESNIRLEGQQQSEWVETHRRFNAVYCEKHEVREERSENGNLYRWQDWMLFCVDPVSHIPIQIDYAERYPVEGGIPSPNFAKDVASFFDSIQFRKPAITARPRAEISAAFVQANKNLFSNIDREDYPAAVVFSLDTNVKDSMLRNLTHQLFMLKGTSLKDSSENAIAKYLTDERGFPTRFFIVPESMSHSDKVFIGDMVIHRALLPKGHIGDGSGYGKFLFRIRAYPAAEHYYLLEHVGIQWLK